MLLPPETWFDDYQLSSGSPPGLRFDSAVEYTKVLLRKNSFWFCLHTSKVGKVLNRLYVLLEVLLPPPSLFSVSERRLAQRRPSEGRQ